MQDEYKIERRPAGDRPEPDAMKRKLVSEGYGVFQWSDPPGAVYDVHQHPTAQSHWIISGTLELEVRDVGTFVLGPGDRDFMPAGTFHSARVIGDGPVVYLIGEKS
jgi:quercetin dioxygenase-like cupin family protein